MSVKSHLTAKMEALAPAERPFQNFFVPQFETTTSEWPWATLKRIPFMRNMLRMMIMDKTRGKWLKTARGTFGSEKTCCQTHRFSLIISGNAPFWAPGKPDLP